MSSNISIGSISVGLGDARNISSTTAFDSNKVDGGNASLLTAAMASINVNSGNSLDFSSINKNETSSLSGPSVSVSLSMGASFRPEASGFDEKKSELQQIAKGISSLNSLGVGMSAHEPAKTTSSSELFGSLLS